MREKLTFEEQAKQLEQKLGCPCTYFPPSKPRFPFEKKGGHILKAYQQARERGEREGFTPVLLVLDEWGNMAEMFGDLEAFRQTMSSTPIEDGRAMLHRFEEDARAEWGEDLSPEELEEHFGQVLGGDMSEGQKITEFLSLTDYQGKQTQPVVLAEIPVKDPWEVFAYLPFGGWNACPAPEEHRAAAKYWFEQYGAVPAVMSMDIVEYILPAPVPRDKAMEVALEQYFFCVDIVEQGVGTVGALAGGLAKSNYWYFWWD